MTYSHFENLIVIMIMLIQIEPYVMILLLSRLLLSTWFYSLDFQWRAFFSNFFFGIIKNTFRSFKKMTFIHVGKNSPLFILDSMDEVTVCRWVIRGNEFLFWNIWRSCMSLHIFIIILLTGETILLLLLFCVGARRFLPSFTCHLFHSPLMHPLCSCTSRLWIGDPSL